MRSIRTICAACLLVCGLTSCGSLVYSPSFMMSDTPLAVHHGQACVAASMLPETQPVSEGRLLHGGGVTSLRYAFSDHVSLQAKYWNAFDNRGGASVSAMIPLCEANADFLHVEFGAANTGNSIDGWAGAMRYGRRIELNSDTRFSIAGGFMFGWNDFHNVGSGAWGAGVLVNTGLSYALASQWTVGLDLAFIWEYDHNNGDRSTLVSPNLCLGWSF